ncbi:MAG TPA: hypothetical protein VGH19_16485 [Verrucomicrobiae bacterium]
MVLKPGEWTVSKGPEVKLLEKAKFWTSFPLDIENKESEIRFRPAKESPLGIHFLRAFGGNNLSPWQAVVLDDLPLIARKDRNNNSLKNALELKNAAVLTGTIQEKRAEFYRLKLAKGESVTIEVLGQRLLTSLDPFLRLSDEQGRQLAFNDDEPGLGKDSRLRYTAKVEQAIIIEVRDSYYQGSDKHTYVLRIGDFPRVNAAWETSVFGLDHAPLSIGKDIGMAQWFTAWTAEGKPAGFMTMAAKTGETQSEAEPNDQQDRATLLNKLPISVYGTFVKNGDTDWYSWEAKKGEKFLVRAQTRSIGLPTDVRLSAHGADGKSTGVSKVAAEDEGVLDMTANADGRMFLRVNHIAGMAGPEQGYRLNIRAAKTGFDARMETNSLVVAAGGTADLKLTVDRLGYDGEIQFNLQPKVEGLSLAKSSVEAKKKGEVTFQVKAEESLSPGSVFQVRVQSVNPAAAGYVRSYSALTNQYGPSSTMASVLDGWITVAIKAKQEEKGKTP